MVVRTLNRGESQKAMEEWKESYPQLPSIDSEYEQIRRDLQELNKQIRDVGSDRKDLKYFVDSQFGLALYEYFWNMSGFSMRVAANDDFWRYLSIKVVPDIVAQRWGKDNESHYWSRPTRIWLRSIWWFVHLAWQGDHASTKALLECSHFTTDTILNFEERSGRNGTYIDAYRKILMYYSKVSSEDIKKFSRGKSDSSDDVFRVVMKLNTAKMMVMDPALCLGGVDGYVKTLYTDAGVQV